MMRRRSYTLALALLLGVAGTVRAQESSIFVLVVGRDTISLEQFSRTATQLQADLLSPLLGSRFRFTVDYGIDGVPTSMSNAFWQASDPDTAAARQRVRIRFPGDSVLVAFENGTVQRFGSQAGSVPFINPSFALMELVLQRAARLGGDRVEVPAFAVQGGQTFPIIVQRLGRDSVLLTIAGAPTRLRVDPENRILGGIVPSQNLRITRTSGSGVRLSITPPDYSAPAGAPYRAIEVRVPTPQGHTLAGTLTLPVGADASHRVPGVITVTGSGLEDRDEAISLVAGYRPFRQLADTLGRNGIATLRMDDRGYGASEGNGGTATSRDFADDIRAGLAWLRGRPEIAPDRLAVIGHSEGGLIAPMVAATDTTLRAIVLLAGPSRTGRRIIDYQQRSAIERAPGLSQAQRDSLREAARAATDSAARTSAWMREFLDYDPLPTARAVRRTPVLIVQGANDRQVTADQASELEAAFKAGGNRDVTMLVFPDANHLLIQDTSGAPEGYSRLPDHAIRADILGAVLEWLRVRLRE